VRSALSTPRKTALGLDELRHRTRGLGQRHRTVLLLVDGQRSLDTLLDMADLAGARPSHFDELVQLGLVALPETPAPASTGRDGSPLAAGMPQAADPELARPSPPAPIGAPITTAPGAPFAVHVAAEIVETVAGPTRSPAPEDAPDPTPGPMPIQILPRWLDATRQPFFDEPADTQASEEQRLHDVRSLLSEALGADALLFAPLTLNRVRSARTTRELIAVVWEIEHHRGHPRRSHPQLLSLQRARERLGMGNTQVNEDSLTTQWPDTQSPEHATP
jgi:hypothetical protein